MSRSTIFMPVFIPIAIIMILLLFGTLVNLQLASGLFEQVLNFTTETFDWFYMLATAVIDSLAVSGCSDTLAWHRSFWVVTEGAVAMALLIAGGLSALQTAAIVSALPFAVIILIPT